MPDFPVPWHCFPTLTRFHRRVIRNTNTIPAPNDIPSVKGVQQRPTEIRHTLMSLDILVSCSATLGRLPELSVRVAVLEVVSLPLRLHALDLVSTLFTPHALFAVGNDDQENTPTTCTGTGRLS